MNLSAYRTVTVPNRQGQDAGEVVKLVELASRFSSTISLRAGDLYVDAKSPMEMMLLEARPGTAVQLSAFGQDARAAVAALAGLIGDQHDQETGLGP